MGPMAGADWGTPTPSSVGRPCPPRWSLPYESADLDGSRKAGDLYLYVKSPRFQILALNLKEHYLGQRELAAHWPPPGDSGPLSLWPACREEGTWEEEVVEARSGLRRGSVNPEEFVNVNSLYTKYTLNLEWVTLTVAMPGIKVNASGIQDLVKYGLVSLKNK